MLYIKSISDSTVEFGDNGDHKQYYSKDLVASSDDLQRVWISRKYTHGKVLNSCEVSEVSIWYDGAYVVYPEAVQFVSNFNLLMNNGTLVAPVEVTTTTTTTA